MASNNENTSPTVGNALPQEKPDKSEKPTDQHPARETSAPAVSAATIGALSIALAIAECLDLRALNDQHVLLPQ